jgi:hypothetical protein
MFIMEPVDYLDWEWDYDREKEVFTVDLEKFESYHNKSDYDWHLFYVFHDIDFLVYNDVIRRRYLIPIGRHQADGSIRYMPLSSEKDTFEQIIHALCVTFDIQLADLEKFNSLPDARWSKPIYGRKKRKAIKPSGKISLELDVSATTAEVVRAHKRILKQLGVKQPRRREYEHPDLVYAIHANLLLNKSFTEIFTDYSAGKLRGYRRSAVITFNSYDSLSRYYNKYKTDIKSRSDT